ncbi:amino acid--[acyl-carrier-protein] ligase [Aquihabitans sp. McL0605]|uniref:amino acid--[acyl-carrier-protein] ligase n=1 Tax=Aquihabitans sp. McL0605 TaxID=3415671 RepID=UPI003CEBA052
MTTTPVTAPSLRHQLVDDGAVVPMGADGLYGRGASFMQVFDGLDRLLTATGVQPHVERFRFPPILPAADLLRTDYLRSFPDLVGAVHSFCGDDHAHAHLLQTIDQGGRWSDELEPTDLVLLPAACYPLYPMASGVLPEQGRVFDVLGLCFRNEPSLDPARMQSFHQREFVHLGSPERTLEFRNRWLERALEIFDELGLEVRAEVANDPFFGRAGRMLAVGQRAAALKYEVVATVADAEHPTAITSANYHLDHLTSAFGIEAPGGGPAHSACIGFGMERIVLALFARHGTDLARWPTTVAGMLT